MIRSFTTSIAILLGAAVVSLPTFVSAAKAGEATALAKSDRLPVHAVATDCAQQVWPHIEASCLRSSGAGGRISEARLIVATQSSAASHNR